MSAEFEEEKLDSPLIVHKVTDASYQKTANEVEVDLTHINDGGSTLERHRFRRVRKKKKWPYVLIAVFLIIIAVICGLYYGGIFKTSENDENTEPETSGSYYTTEENKYKGIITVKGSYIFFEGNELDGTEALAKEIKYLDQGTKFIVQDENADDSFLSEEILPLLNDYGIEYEVKFVISSGLQSKYEMAETSAAAGTSDTAVSE